MFYNWPFTQHWSNPWSRVDNEEKTWNRYIDSLLNKISTDDLLHDVPPVSTSWANFFGQTPGAQSHQPGSPKVHKACPVKRDYIALGPHFAYQSKEVIQHTFNKTTQLAKTMVRFPMRKHFKSQFKMLGNPRLNEVIATNTYFSSIKSIEGYTCSQVSYGCTLYTKHVYSMKTESVFPSTYQDFLHDQGIPPYVMMR